jgi:glycosyltransferase involved in cell wall biosynthesis
MRLLILSHNPDRASFRQRIGMYLPRLEAQGIVCVVEKSPANKITRWKLFSKADQFDAVLLHKNTLNFWEAYVLRKHARKIIYDFDDAIMVSPHKPDSRHSSHYRLFARTAALADFIIAGNSYLAEFAKPFCQNVHILPTGLDTKKYNVPKPQTDGKIRLVWIGSKSTLNYLHMLTPVLGQIADKYPHVVLRMICDTFFDMPKMPVEKCSWSLETEAKDLAACDIGLCPLPDDNFTRGKGGFKILQYFAAGLPAIASPVGFNIDLVQPDKTGLLASSPQQWHQALKTLIENPTRRQTIGQTAKEFARQFDQELIGQKFCNLLIQFLPQ